ncbi:MAG TPA: hypothetical protein VF406_03050 [Thermodesulfobacteriota bacterium]
MSGREAIVLAVLRGERPLEDLRQAGVGLTIEGPMVLVDPNDVRVAPTTADVARGLLAYEGRGDDRRRWAFAMVAGDFLDLDPLTADPDGGLLLSALWDASFGDPLPDDARAAARRLAH